MKSIVSAILLVVFVVSLPLAPSARADGLNIYFDGVEVSTEPVIYYVSDDSWTETEPGSFTLGSSERPGIYYMDVQPETKSGRVFVPLRVISNYFSAEISWQEPQVLLKLGDTTLTLTIGSETVLSNEVETTLEAAPYIKEGRTMVPLRFISEAFGCDVDFVDGSVYINTPPLLIDGRKVVSIQSWYGMTMGGVRRESKTNICTKKYYQLLQDSAGDEIAEPKYYGRHQYIGDVANTYYPNREVSFMESDGLEGEVIQMYELYNRMNDSPEWLANANTVGEDLGKWLIRDITHDKWYKVKLNSFQFYRDDIYNIGDWEMILNDIV